MPAATGSGIPLSFVVLVKKIIEIVGSRKVEYTEFTTERTALEPADYYADITKIRNSIGWEPCVTLEEA